MSTFIVRKLNIGSPRTYSSAKRLLTAITKSGAKEAEISPKHDEIAVLWPENKDVVRYPIKDGVVDEQLAWDMED